MAAIRNALAVILLSAIGSVHGLGINCRGSGACPFASFNRPDAVDVMEGLRDGIWLSTQDNSTMYNSGDHIICVSTTSEVTIGVDAGAKGVDASLSTNGKIGNGGVCAFPQDLAEPLSLEMIKELADALLKHGCTTCGSVPVHFVDEGSNDPGQGILTFNYVASPYCIETCISKADGNDGSTDDSVSAAAASAVTNTPTPTTTDTGDSPTADASATDDSSSGTETNASPTDTVTPATDAGTAPTAAGTAITSGSGSTVTTAASASAAQATTGAATPSDACNAGVWLLAVMGAVLFVVV